MPELFQVVVLVGGLFVGMAIFNQRSPDKVQKYWKIVMASLSTMAFWVLFERIGTFTSNYGNGWIIFTVVIGIIVFALYGLNKATFPGRGE